MPALCRAATGAGKVTAWDLMAGSSRRGALRRGQGARTLRADVHERPRRYRSEASRGSLRHKRLVAEDQKPRLLAERGAADRAYGRLVVEIKRLVPAPGVGSGWKGDSRQPLDV